MTAIIQATGDPPWPYNNFTVPNSQQFTSYPVSAYFAGLLNESAHIEREKIRALIGDEAIKKLVDAGYEVIRR